MPALLKENRRKFTTDNLEIVPGTAPEAMVELPVSTHAFIGRFLGNMNEIIRLLLDKNPKVRIVINCITLETVTEAMNAIRDFSLTDVDIVQLSAARSKSIGRYHMMMGENPIYIISCSGRGEGLGEDPENTSCGGCQRKRKNPDHLRATSGAGEHWP